MKGKLQQFILSGKEIFIGLEVAKRMWVLCVRSSGAIVNETSMPAKYHVLQGYLQNKFPSCKVHVIYEAGFGGFGLHDSLKSDGYNCVVTPPHTVTQEKHSTQKNDKLDARRLAKVLETKDYKECFVHDSQHRDDRMLCRRLQQVRQEIVREKNRMRRDLEFCGLDPMPEKVTWCDRDYMGIVEMIKARGASSTSIETMESIVRVLGSLRAEYLLLLKKIRVLARSAKYLATVKIFKSTPGIGELTAIRLALEWGTLSRFETKAQFAKFTGLIPKEHSTGETHHTGHITKQGNPQVRSYLIESSWTLIRRDPVMAEVYCRLKQQTGSGKKAIVGVARKLAIRLRAMMLSQKEYAIGVIK